MILEKTARGNFMHKKTDATRKAGRKFFMRWQNGGNGNGAGCHAPAS
jgi:hypothetical protein